jgi:choice-of-anchor B domain-containing protein
MRNIEAEDTPFLPEIQYWQRNQTPLMPTIPTNAGKNKQGGPTMDIFTRGVPAVFLLTLFVSPAWPQTNVSLVGHVAIGGGFVTDVWEYVDTTTGNRYALVGTFGTVSIVDVTDAANPAIVTTIGVPGFDVKVWGQYMYGVTGGGGTNQGKIVDLTDPASPQIVGSFNSAHNIFISESGYLFAESPGLKVYDLNPDPLAPALVWDSGDGGGHDAAVIGNMVYDFHGDATNIYEASFGSPFSLSLLGTIDDPAIAYHHSGWTSEDGRYLFICDELADHPTPDITVWDISDPLYPVNVDDYADPNATVHNLYVIGRFAYVSYYTSGFRVFDVTNPIMSFDGPGVRRRVRRLPVLLPGQHLCQRSDRPLCPRVRFNDSRYRRARR